MAPMRRGGLTSWTVARDSNEKTQSPMALQLTMAELRATQHKKLAREGNQRDASDASISFQPVAAIYFRPVRSWADSVSQMRTVKSPEAEARRVPSALKATAWM